MKEERDGSPENTGENTGTAAGCPENLRPYMWQKGQPSPNPGGRPKRAPISDAYKDLIGEPLPEDMRSRLKLPEGATWAHALALGQLRSAVKGNTPAAKEIADRIEGRVSLPVEVETPENKQVHFVIEYTGDSKETGS
jgi:hypothetical protein